MKTKIFDGKLFAQQKEKRLKTKVTNLKKSGTSPKLVVLLIGDDPASILYTNLKQKKAKQLGIELEINYLPTNITHTKVIKLISLLALNKFIHGIMIQLPLPKSLQKHQSKIFASIPPQKDPDGLNPKSNLTPATTKAVLDIIQQSKLDIQDSLVAVVGSKGVTGKSIIRHLKKSGYKKIIQIDKTTKNKLADLKKANLIISATGIPNIIKKENVKKGAIVIDIGSPKPDVDFKNVSKVSSFITPVPGGVGPVTIISLLENLVEKITKETHVS